MKKTLSLVWVALFGALSFQNAAQNFDQTYPQAGATNGEYLEKSGSNYVAWTTPQTKSNPAEWTVVTTTAAGAQLDVSTVSMPNPEGRLIFRAPDGRYLTAFKGPSGSNGITVYIQEITPTGSVPWSNSFVFPNADLLEVERMATNAANQIFVGGTFHPTGTDGATRHVFLLKLGSSGQAIWQASTPNYTQPYWGSLQFLAPTQDGGCYAWVVGETPQSGVFGFNANGVFIGSSPQFGTFRATPLNPATFADGKVLVAYSIIPPPLPVGIMGFLKKLNPDGSVIWEKTANQILKSPAGQDAFVAEIFSINTTPDGRIWMAGFESPALLQPANFFAAELDGDGNLIKKETGAYVAQPRFIREFDDGSVLVAGSKNDQFWLRRFTNGGNAGTIDLELSALATNPNPAPNIFTAAKYTLQNKGSVAAQNIRVKINLPASGLPLKGGDEFSASQGSFDPYGNQIWTVGSLAAGASAVLNLNFFNLNTSQKVVYAQVQQASGIGDDSTPGNGACCTPVEDDEAAATFNGPGGSGADLSLQLQWNETLGNPNFTLTINNAGPGTATGVVVAVGGLPGYMAVNSASQGTVVVPSREWQVGSLPAGATATLNYDIHAVDFPYWGPGYAFAEVKTSSQGDPDSTPGNDNGQNTANEDDEATVLAYPDGVAVFHDINLIMTSNKTSAFPGDEVEVLIKTAILGFTVGGVTAKVDLPADFQLVTATPSAGTFNPATGIWNIGYIERPDFPGSEKSLTLRLKIVSIAAPKTVFAQIMSSKGLNEPDSQPGNGTCCTPLEDDEAAVTIAPASNGSCQNNLLVNPGFENDFSNWDNLGGGSITSDAKTGSKAVKICGSPATAVIQTIPTQPGKTYTLLGWAKRGNPLGPGMLLQMKFMNSSWQNIGIEAANVSSTVYTAYTKNATAPPGAAWLEVAVFKHSGEGCVFADELCLTENGGGSGKPDLAFDLSEPRYTPPVIQPGSPFRARVTFSNIGTAPATNFQIALFVSKKNVLDNTAILLQNYQTIYNLQAGDEQQLYFDASIPGNTLTGDAFFIVKLDNLDQLAESDEGNNFYVAPTYVSGGYPNLKIGTPTTTPSVVAGGSISVNVPVFSKGPAAMPPQTTRVYFSTDNALSVNDMELFSYNAGALAVCGENDFNCYSFSFAPIQIPASTAPGAYFILVKLDADDAVPESSENDNLGFALLTVSGSGIPGCGASGDFPWHEWISEVEVNGTARPSGKSQYSNFTPAVFTATKGAPNPIELTASWSYFTYDELWAVWIDSNHDLIFQPTEKVFDGYTSRPPDGSNVSKTISGTFNLPADALTGPAKMRVAMQRGSSPEPCGTFPYGEVEDYTVNVAAALQSGDERKEEISNFSIPNFEVFPNPAGDAVQIHFSNSQGKNLRLTLLDPLGLPVLEKTFSEIASPVETLDLSGVRNGQYFLKMEIEGQRRVVKKLVVSRLY